MIQNMERAAADDFEALLRQSPHPVSPIPAAPAQPEADALVCEMRDVILGLAHAGLGTTEADLRQRGFTAGEIATLGPRAASAAAAALRSIECNGVRRARVRAA